MKRRGAYLFLLAFSSILIAACAAPPQPEMLEERVQATPTAVPEAHVLWLPVVAAGAPGKAGVAFSSHTDGAERVALLGRSVAYWRGWQVGGALPGDKWGLAYTPSLWCDFFARKGVTTTLQYQLHVLDALGSDYSGPLLFLNEPDLGFYGHYGQCEVSPYRAAQLYVHVREKLPHAQLVGPGLSHVDYIQGYRWLDAWWRAVVAITGEPPEMAAWDVHNYIQQGDPLAPYDALEAWLVARGVENPKFWITEWGTCNAARAAQMKSAFDGDARIERHYWYDQYKAYWDGEQRCMTLFVEGRLPLQLSDLGEAWMSTAPTPEARAGLAAYP